MTLPQDDLTQTKAAACVAASIVRTLNDFDPTLKAEFYEALCRAYRIYREQGGSVHGIEVFSLTKQLLLGRVQVADAPDSDNARESAAILSFKKTDF